MIIIHMLFGFTSTEKLVLSDYRRLFTRGRCTGKSESITSIYTSKSNRNSTPVWTAFVTHNLGRRGWLKSADPRTVIVSELKLAIFMSTDDYTPPRTSRDEHILKFASRSGSSPISIF